MDQAELGFLLCQQLGWTDLPPASFPAACASSHSQTQHGANMEAVSDRSQCHMWIFQSLRGRCYTATMPSQCFTLKGRVPQYHKYTHEVAFEHLSTSASLQMCSSLPHLPLEIPRKPLWSQNSHQSYAMNQGRVVRLEERFRMAFSISVLKDLDSTAVK